MSETNNIYIIGDTHGRQFFQNIFNVTDKPVIFLGDEMDPYGYEGYTDEDCIRNLKDIIEYKKSRPDDVTLLVGNHSQSFIWSYQGFERTDIEYYKEVHKIYRDNIKLFNICKLIKDTLFTHAGVSNGWLTNMNRILKEKESSLVLDEKTIVPYLENEYQLELRNDTAPIYLGWYNGLESEIFNIGWSRGGSGYGGPTWCDFNDEFINPEWNLWQVFGHTQGHQTGLIRQKYHGFCVDSRAVFEYNLDNHTMELSPLTTGYEKIKARLDTLVYEE